MPRIVDNIDTYLRDLLLQTLERSTGLDSSVGYFNLRGWASLKEAVDALHSSPDGPAVRLLVGMADSPGSELRRSLRIARSAPQMDNQTAARLRDEATREFREQLTWGIPSDADEDALRALKQQIESGKVQVRLFLRHPLHAKLYLLHRDDPDNPRTGFVGSSNLTFSGLGGQGELNVDVLDHDATEKLAQWFEDRWNDTFSLEINEQLLEVLSESWASSRSIDPYLIYLKMAYHLSRDARAGMGEYGLPGAMAQKLLKFQSAAVRITARHLMNRGGAMVGDVTGLGKTLVATAVALLLQEEQGFETLIIAPRNLVDMWRGYVELYGLKARVVSLSMVHDELADLRRYRLVVIDESHNLRNPRRRDYAAIRDYVQANDPRLLLLTATPFNKSMKDVVGQLSLFIDDDVDLGIRPENAISALGETEFLGRCDDKPSTLKAFTLSDHPEDWQRLLGQFLIRRTRRFIRDNYAEQDESGRYFLRFEDGSIHFLPDRRPRPLPHSVAEGDPAGEMESEAVLDDIERLKLPRYDLSSYLDRNRLTSEAERQVLDRIERGGGNLIGFIRTSLMKRLSSNGAVFLLSLRRHLLRNLVYSVALTEGRDLPIGTFREDRITGDMDEGDDWHLQDPEGSHGPGQLLDRARLLLASLTERAPAGISWLPAEVFTQSLVKSLENDNEILSGLLDRFGSWDTAADTKIDALEKLLLADHPTEKVLVFTEYADTAEYVREALKDRGVEQVEAVTGGTSDPTRLARRFSPRSNEELGGLPRGERELRILVATDVLSEGQNLQDAAIVVNFDLPWAIIRLIQRAGRVDRIGQRASEVFVYSFLPSEGVEGVLGLRRRIAERLERNALMIGSDERFLNTPGEINMISNVFDENAEYPEEDEDAEVDYSSAAYEIWRHALENHPDLAEAASSLPDVTYSTLTTEPKAARWSRMSRDDHSPEGVLTYTLSSFGFDRFVQSADGERPYPVPPNEALSWVRCEPGEPPAERLTRHHDLVGEGIEYLMAADDVAPAEMMTGVRRRLYERLRNQIVGTMPRLFGPPDAIEQALDALIREPLTEQAKQALSRGIRSRGDEELAQLVVQLFEEGMLTVDIGEDLDEVQIVCSMGFRGS